MAKWGPTAERVVTSPHNWREPLRWNEKARIECDATGKRPAVFCSSLADVFEARDELDAPREWLWELIERTPYLFWLLLTKRPENAVDMVPRTWAKGWPRHVALGTTVESQRYADQRIPHLLQAPAMMRFLSVEPLLAAVDLTAVAIPNRPDETEVVTMNVLQRASAFAPHVHWVIVGGESGHGARPMHPDWARSIRDQCVAAGVPFFFKQGSQANWPDFRHALLDGTVWRQMPEGVTT